MSLRNKSYLDANSSAPLAKNAQEALLRLLSNGDGSLVPNPSSVHAHGRLTKKALSEAREFVAASISAPDQKIDREEILFTSSGSEANQMIIRSVLEAALAEKQRSPVHWITTPVEHDSVLQMVEWMKRLGGEVSFIPVDAQGRPIPEAIASLWRPHTKLVSVVWVNNETGVVSPIPKIAREVEKRGGILHLDAAQAWGKVPLRAQNSRAHFISLSAHKIGGLAGSGAIWARPGSRLHPLVLGKQEKGRRGGTENVLGVVAMGAAAQAIHPEKWSQELEPLRDRLEKEISLRIPGVIVNGASAPRVANTSNLIFDGVDGEGLMIALDMEGWSVSTGSACASGVVEPSHVLLSMGRSREQAKSALRISLHSGIQWGDLEKFLEKLEKTVERVRRYTSLDTSLEQKSSQVAAVEGQLPIRTSI